MQATIVPSHAGVSVYRGIRQRCLGLYEKCLEELSTLSTQLRDIKANGASPEAYAVLLASIRMIEDYDKRWWRVLLELQEDRKVKGVAYDRVVRVAMVATCRV
jgi:hypothetical protein